MVFIQGGKFSHKNMTLKRCPIYALEMDGFSTNYVNIPSNASINNLTTTSIVARITLTEGILTSPHIMNRNNQYRIYIANIPNVLGNLRINLDQRFSISGDYWISSIIKLSNIKSHIATTYDNTSVANNPIMYLNGNIVANTVQQGPPLGTANIATGACTVGNFPGNNGFVGLIHEFAYFNIILTSIQVSNLYNGSIKPNEIPGCVIYHDYTKGHAQDLSGNGNHGTLIGNPHFTVPEHKTFYSLNNRY